MVYEKQDVLEATPFESAFLVVAELDGDADEVQESESADEVEESESADEADDMDAEEGDDMMDDAGEESEEG
jgi:hypothetical protein